MDEELEKQLIKKYPNFFEYLKDYEGPIMPIQFGFECGDGWYVLIESLMDSINSYIKSREKYPRTQIKSKFWRIVFQKLNHLFRYQKRIYKFLNKFKRKLKKENLPAPHVDIVQVKEKFGSLRFYINGGDDYIYGMIDLAENMSYRTCETCGSTKNIVQTTRGWISTICKECLDKTRINPEDWRPIK